MFEGECWFGVLKPPEAVASLLPSSRGVSHDRLDSVNLRTVSPADPTRCSNVRVTVTMIPVPSLFWRCVQTQVLTDGSKCCGVGGGGVISPLLASSVPLRSLVPGEA